MVQPTIRVENLGKRFRFYDTKWRRVIGAFFPSGNHFQELWALRKLNFEIPRGSTLGIIGANGSGKTTLLQVLAGLVKPTEGTVGVDGNLATLLELTSGFQTDFTGRENIFLSSGLRGFSKRDVEKKVEKIISFSELDEFIDRPIRHYSTGMLMRLAFATAINVDPDVLLIDEVFAVGDIAFQHKCTRKFRELQKQGTTIVLVTHDMMAVKSLCNITLLLDHGSMIQIGSAEDITNIYLNLMAQKIAGETFSEIEHPVTEEHLEPAHGEFLSDLQSNPKMHRHGSGEGRICAIQILNSRSLPTELVAFGEEVIFRFYVEYEADVPYSGLGFYVRDRYGNDVIGINTFEENKPLGSRKKGDRVIVDFKLPLLLRPGSYTVSPGLSYHRSEPRYLDWIDSAAFFQMEKPLSGQEIYGFMHVPNRISVQHLR
jgi:lipopolysaccharide transport system ATP-binding protein